MKINYSDDVINTLKEERMSSDLWQLAYDDINLMDSLEISNDKERNLYFYIDHFVDDILEEMEIKDYDRNKVVENSFKKLREKEKVDLLDIRKAIFECVDRKLSNKTAYPNIIGVNELNTKQVRDVDKWVDALYKIYENMYRGESRDLASKQVMEGWDPMSKLDFNNWSKFYEEKNHEKYNVKTAATLDELPIFQGNDIDYSQDLIDPVVEQQEYIETPVQKVKKVKTKEDLRSSLISRLDSASKLLREFVNVWPREVWENLSQALSDLKREVVLLKSEATIEDCIIRTANVWERSGFSEGAGLLRKIAVDPTDTSSEIEQALSGKKEEEPVIDAPQEDIANIPPAGAGEDMPPPEPPPAAEEVTALPPLPPDAPDKEQALPELTMAPETETSPNPYEGRTIQDVLNVLDPLAQQLSERKIVRELAKADMILDALNIASHFPELSEAMARMIESTIYVHTRLEKVITKLKGGLREEDESGVAPEVEMNELSPSDGAPPVEPQAQSPVPNEKEMFEVTEEPEVPAEEPLPELAKK
jgi:hypothetical protein